MKCQQASQGLIAYLDGRAEPAERRQIEEHLSGCAACRARAEAFRGVWKALDEVPSIEPSFGFDARVRQRVAAQPRPGWFSLNRLAPQARLALAAVLLITLTVWVARLPLSKPAQVNTSTAATEQDFNAIKNLGVLENYDVVTSMDALSELVPTTAKQPDQPPRDDETND